MKPQTVEHTWLKLEAGNHTDAVVALALSKDGRTLVSAGENTLRVWDVPGRKLLRQILGHTKPPGGTYAGMINALALTPDGRWAVTVKDLWHRIEVFDVDTGNLVSAFERPDRVTSLAFSPDGRWLALGANRLSGEDLLLDGAVELLSTRALTKAGFDRPPAPDQTCHVGQARRATKDAGVNLEVTVRWIPAPLTDLPLPGRPAAGFGLVVAVRSDTDGSNGRLHWLAFQPGRGLRDLHSHAADQPLDCDTLAVSATAVVVATRYESTAADPARKLGRLIALDHQARVLGQTVLEQAPAAAAFSPDGQALAVGLRGHLEPAGLYPALTVVLAVGPSGFALRSTYYGHDWSVKAVAWLGNDTVLSAGGDNNAIHRWSPGARVGLHVDAFRGVGQGLLDGAIDEQDQLRFNTVPERMRAPNQAKRQLRFDLRALKLFAVGPDEPDTTATGKARWLPYDAGAQIVELGHEPDATHEAETYFSHLQLRLFVGTDDVWVLWTPSGFYATNAPEKSRIGYCVDRGPHREALYLPADRFPIFEREDIVRAVIQHGSEERARAHGVAIPPVEVSALLPPVVEIERYRVAADGRQVHLVFDVEPPWAGQATTRLWILRNERFVWFEDDAQALRRRRWRLTLRLNPGRNVFKILAQCPTAKSVPCVFEVDGPAHADARVEHQAGKGKLFVLSVGVSDFKIAGTAQAGKTQVLDFAHRDAIAVYNALAGSRHSARHDPRMPLRNAAFDSVSAKLLVDEQATKAAILEQARRFADEIVRREREAAAERDVLLVFLSGHGVRFAGESELYFWNWDLINSSQEMERTGLSLVEFAEIATAVPAEVVLVIDACHSGMAGNNLMRGLDPEELARRIRAVHERGLYVINASRSEQLSKERAELRHGLLTHALLRALRDRRYASGADRSLSMMGLIAAIQELVPAVAARLGIGKPQTPTCRLYGDLLPLTIYRPPRPGRASPPLRGRGRSDSVAPPRGTTTRGRQADMATQKAAAKKAPAKKAPAKKAAAKKAPAKKAPAKKAPAAKKAAPAKKALPGKVARKTKPRGGDKPGEDVPRLR